MTQRKRRADWFHRYLANAITVRLPTQVVLETTGRRTGLPRRTPVGGRIISQQFWMVAGDGEAGRLCAKHQGPQCGSTTNQRALASGDRSPIA